MNYSSITDILSAAPNSMEAFEHIAKTEPSKLNSRSAKNRIAKEISTIILSLLQRSKTKPAVTSMQALILLVGPSDALDQIKRDGVLRASKYNFNISSLKVFLAHLTNNFQSYGFQRDDERFFKSVSALYKLSKPLAEMRASIVKRFRQNKLFVIKAMLAEVDSRFSYGSTPRSEALGLPAELSNEEIAESFSYLLGLFNSSIGISAKHFAGVDLQSGYSSVYLELLVDGVSICQYREAEVLIESFPYIARIENGKVVIEATDPSVEISTRIGYMQAEMQINLRLDDLRMARKSNTKIASIQTFAENFFLQGGEQFIRLVNEPIARYVVGLPILPRINQLFSEDHVFLEDISTLELLGNEDYVLGCDVLHLPVVGDLNVIDILKAQRLIRFMQIGMTLAINNHQPVAERVGLELISCIPVMKINDLLTILEQAVGPEKAPQMIKFLSSDFSKDFIDIQYTPFLIVDGICMFSMATFAASNLVRNVLTQYKKRLTLRDLSSIDPMQNSLKEALVLAGFFVQDEFDPGTVAEPREIDIFAYKDGHLFLFECKNSFHPCNVFERRTSFQYINYAAQQLELRKIWLTDKNNQKKAFKKLCWDVLATDNIHTCIALGNRVFNGYVCNGHPVRSVHELLNTLSGGMVALKSGQLRIWNSDKFEVDDLIQQIGPNSTVSDFIAALVNLRRSVVIGSTALCFETFALSFEKLEEIVRNRYPVIIDSIKQ